MEFPTLPQDVLNEVISHLTDIPSLSQCALASKCLLYQSRFNQFSSRSVQINSRNRDLATDILSSPLCSIPSTAIRALTITGIFFQPLVGDEERKTNNALSHLRHVELLELSGLQWPAFPASNRHMLSSHLSTVKELRLHDMVVSSHHEVVEFTQSFPLLSRLSVQRIDLMSGMVNTNAVFSPMTTESALIHGESAHATLSRARRSHLERLELSVDDSDALSVIGASSINLRFPQVVFLRSPFDDSTKSYTSIQNEILKNIGNALLDLTFVVSGFNTIAPPSDLSFNTSLQKIHPVCIDINLRRLGSRPFNTLLSTLSSLISSPSSPGTMQEVDLTFHFINWLGEVDCDLLIALWDWTALDDILMSFSESPRVSPSSSRMRKYTCLNSVRINLDWSAIDGKKDSLTWLDSVSGRIRASMRRCDEEGVLTIQNVDASKYVNS